MGIKLSKNRYKICIGISLAVICMVLCLLQNAVKQGLVFAVAFLLLSFAELNCGSLTAKWLNVIWCLFTAVAAVFLSQLLLDIGTGTIPTRQLILGMVVVEFVLGLVFLVTMNFRATVLVGIFSALALATVNHFVFWLRGSEFAPYDFLAAATAMNVAGKYTFTLTKAMLYAYIIGALYCCCGYVLPKSKVQRSAGNMLRVSCAVVLLYCTFFFGSAGIGAQHFGQMGSFNNGYLLNFALQFRNLRIQKPDDYSVEAVRELEAVYEAGQTDEVHAVDIIVIMSEAFGDLRVIQDAMETDVDIMPFVSSLSENTIRGHALVSGIGGGTSKSEYEFLTSNSLGLLPVGCFPFQQYIRSGSYSIVAGLENYGFTSLGTHPASGDNWMRTTVYPSLGFDTYSFVEDYPQKILLRDMVSDREMFKELICRYEEKNLRKNGFFFGVTMQNHSPYDFADIAFSCPVNINGLVREYPDAEQYLSLLNESDKAFEALITYFKSVDRDVVIAVFGDHMPQLSTAFYEELHGGAFDTLEEQMLQYTVPFFVWANFDIEERDAGLTSLNFLANYVYEAARLPLPAYNAFLKDVQAVIPAMNIFGYYSHEKGTMIPYEEAEGKEAEMLERYRILQYNCIFDEKNRSDVFFPAA